MNEEGGDADAKKKTAAPKDTPKDGGASSVDACVSTEDESAPAIAPPAETAPSTTATTASIAVQTVPAATTVKNEAPAPAQATPAAANIASNASEPVTATTALTQPDVETETEAEIVTCDDAPASREWFWGWVIWGLIFVAIALINNWEWLGLLVCSALSCCASWVYAFVAGVGAVTYWLLSSLLDVVACALWLLNELVRCVGYALAGTLLWLADVLSQVDWALLWSWLPRVQLALGFAMQFGWLDLSKPRELAKSFLRWLRKYPDYATLGLFCFAFVNLLVLANGLALTIEVLMYVVFEDLNLTRQQAEGAALKKKADRHTGYERLQEDNASVTPSPEPQKFLPIVSTRNTSRCGSAHGRLDAQLHPDFGEERGASVGNEVVGNEVAIGSGERSAPKPAARVSSNRDGSTESHRKIRMTILGECGGHEKRQGNHRHEPQLVNDVERLDIGRARGKGQ